MCTAVRTCLWCFLFFKQKTSYEMLISDWSSDVCSSDLEKRAELAFESRYGGPWTARTYFNKATGEETMALIKGRVDPARPTLVRMHTLSIFRSEESRVGKECVSTCRSRWSP